MSRFLRVAGSVLTAVALISLARPAPAAELDDYLNRPEPAYRWEKKGEFQREGCKVHDLLVTSQVWQGFTWQHRVLLFQPEKVEYPGFCGVYNTGGNGGENDQRMGVRMAKESNALFAMVFGIPRQPIFGLTEDGLVVSTWLKYMETGDPSWPLHFPMAKGVLKSMDALQAYAPTAGLPPLRDFVIAGASKRGWTTWLCGASQDPRIKAIVPMVIDVLKVREQSNHMLKSWGEASEQIEDYTRVGMMKRLETPAGKRLMRLEDPISYKARLTLPKLLILGTNDRYWTQDALNLYWGDLRGPKWVLYAPNSGHGLDDRERVYATWGAFLRAVASGRSFPKLDWSYRSVDGGGAELRVRATPAPREGRLFRTAAGSLDFRDSRWNFEPMKSDRGQITGLHPGPSQGFAATFGEMVFELDGKPFTLSTQIRILRSPTVRSDAKAVASR